MVKHPTHYLELMEVGRLVQSRQMSSQELTQQMFERIETLEPQLHSYASVMQESAMAQALVADQEIAMGMARGPLHGVPLAVKDLLSTTLAPTSHGQPMHLQRTTPHDATAVSRLHEAGAVILGKLQQTEGAFADHHPQITAPVNPWDSTLWPGVSSSGSGVATAAGLCFGALGTDTGGSIRFPSNANGLTGLKPSWGRVSRAGVFELAASMDHVGPMARSAADVAAILYAIAGPDVRDPTASTAAVPDYLMLMPRGLTHLRVGVDTSWILDQVDDSTKHMLTDVMGILEKLSAQMIPIRFPDVEKVLHDWVPLCSVETAVAHEATYPSRKNEYGPALSALIDSGHALSACEYQKMLLRRADFRGRLNRVFSDVDLVLVPVCGHATLTLKKMATMSEDPVFFADMLRYTCPFDISGHPTITLPGWQTPQGTPIGFQLVAAHMREDHLIRAAWAFQRVTTWHRQHPDV